MFSVVVVLFVTCLYSAGNFGLNMAFLSIKDCNRILQGKFQNPHIQYISHDLKPISEDSEGFFGEHYKLKISYLLDGKQETENVFVKTKARGNQTQTDFANQAGVYKREIFMYDVMFKEFAKYGYDISFSPKSYYCIPNQTLVMEDLIVKGYQLTERPQLFSMDKLKCVLKALAKYHAAGIVYDRTKSKELERSFKLGKEYPEVFDEVLFCNMNDLQGLMLEWWKGSYDTFDKVIDVLPYDEEYKREFKTLIKNYPIGKSHSVETQLVKTCGHGDLWSNNMMFRLEGGIAVDCCLVDFQFCRYFYPAMDVMLAIFTNTDAEFRQCHLDELYQYYYDILSELLLQYGYIIDEIMTRKNFHESIEIVKVETLFHVAGAIGMVYVPKEKLTETMEQGSEAIADAFFHKRGDMIVEAYANNSFVRKQISEAMRDLRDALHDEVIL